MAIVKTLVYAVCLLALLPSLGAQAVYTASRKAEIQVGLAASSYTLDYGEGREAGFTIFADADFTSHLGVEALYRNASIQTPHDIGENHVLVGPRLHLTRGRFVPYVKVLIGTGTINYQQGYNANASSQTYFIYALGGGLDVNVTRRINVRALDFEYQSWPTFKPHGLTPTGFSVGVAYKF